MQDRDIRTVALIGVGTVGSGWAAFYTMKGLSVRLYDAKPQARAAARVVATQSLCRLRDLGLLDAQWWRRPDSIRAATLEEACGRRLHAASAHESYAVKPIFEQADRRTTGRTDREQLSGLLVSELQAAMRHLGEPSSHIRSTRLT